MAWAIGVALAALCLAAVGHPLLRKRSSSPPEQSEPIAELEQQRQGIYQEARVLHNDYVLGDVPVADYQVRLQEYRLQAAHLLYQQERLQELDRGLEAEILGHRSAAEPGMDTPQCPECGSPTNSGMNQCASCGAALSPTARSGL